MALFFNFQKTAGEASPFALYLRACNNKNNKNTCASCVCLIAFAIIFALIDIVKVLYILNQL